MLEEKRCSQCGGELPGDAPEGLCPRCLMKAGLPTGIGENSTETDGGQAGPATSSPQPAAFTPPKPAELAKQFPHLEIIELLGQGGMGAVYKAKQKHLERIVALKILPPEISEDPAFAERFAREARSLARLNHPRIVTVYDFGHTEQGLYYFIMEFVDGTDLRKVIRTAEISPKEALAVVPQICDALQYAHEEGIVHRDIKPENILIDKRGRVKIADFGLAKLLDRPAAVYTLTYTQLRMGTPLYMAPEQIERPHRVDHRADIYSLGVVFYEMLTGELPLGRFAPPSQKVQVDVRLDDVVLRSLEKEPERRYQHASEVKTEVETIAKEPQMGVRPRAAVPGRQRLSKTAVVGVCWAPLALLLPAAAILLYLPLRVGTGPGRNVTSGSLGTGIAFFMIPFVLLGLTAPFGTTILGAAAISHIRHSAGRLYGMGLALFDTLLFPLMVLDAVIFSFLLFLFLSLPEPFASPGPAILVATLACIAADFVIVRWAWRKATKGLETIRDNKVPTQQVEATPQPETAPAQEQKQTSDAEEDKSAQPITASAGDTKAVRRRLRVPLIGLTVSGVINLVLLPFALHVPTLWQFFAHIKLPNAPGAVEAAILTMKIAVSIVVIMGVLEMWRLRSYVLAAAGSILAMSLISRGFILGLPMGIWALVLLVRPEVRAAFSNSGKST